MPRWKQSLKLATARAARLCGALRTAEVARADTWTIVCYHRVLPAPQKARYFCPDLVVTPEAFDAHCAFFRQHFDVVTVAEGRARMQSGTRSPRRLLSLSFDDGYQDNFVHARPVLARHGLSASFYVIAGLVDTPIRPWYDAAALACSGDDAIARDKVESMKALSWDAFQDANRGVDKLLLGISAPDPHDLIMTSEQLRTLLAEGHEIGSHSLRHPILPRLPDDELAREFARSREILRACGHAVAGFCYPNGDFDDRVADAARKAGYAYALSTREGTNLRAAEAFRLARVFVHEERLTAPNGISSPELLRFCLAFATPTA